MIDTELRSTGIGASEIAAVVGLDSRRDQFSVYVDKLGLVERNAPTVRMKSGKRFERPIAEWYGEVAGVPVQWFDSTLANSQRSWQVFTADAFVLRNAEQPVAAFEDIARRAAWGEDSKLVSWDQVGSWGQSGTDLVPDTIALQAQWSCSATGLPFWDIAAVFGLDDLRIYRIHSSPEIQAVLLEEGHKFWHNHVLRRVPPKPGPSPATGEALKKMFPKHTEAMRPALPEEEPLIEALKTAKIAFKAAERAKDEAEHTIQFAIGDADGLILGKEKITWKKSADTRDTDWETIARTLHATLLGCAPKKVKKVTPSIELMAAETTKVMRVGARKLLTPRAWTKEA